MATIRKRGGKFQAIVRRGHHSQAKTFFKRADAEHWAKRLEIEIERNVAALPNSADGITFGELIQSYKKRGIESQKGIGRTKSYNLERLYEYFSHFPAQLAKHHLLEFAEMRTVDLSKAFLATPKVAQKTSLGRAHNALQHCTIRQKRQLCVRFRFVYCLAVAPLPKL